MLSAILLGALSCSFLVDARELSGLQRFVLPKHLLAREEFSHNVSSCSGVQYRPLWDHAESLPEWPGYTLNGVIESRHGLTAKLALAGPPCNAFGADIEDLTIQVTYESHTRFAPFHALPPLAFPL